MMLAYSRLVEARVTLSIQPGYFRQPVIRSAYGPVQIFVERRRSALPITETELKLIAAAAIIGDSSKPKNG